MTSALTGEDVYVGPYTLTRLAKINPSDCVMVDDESEIAALGIDDATLESMKRIVPRPDGMYEK